jgi:hypothetical protein
MATDTQKSLLRFALVGGVFALRVVRFAVVTVAFLLAAGMLKYSFGWTYPLLAFLAGFVSFRFTTYLYANITRELITANSLLDETLKTVYISLTVIPANMLVFPTFAFIGIGFLHAGEVPAEIKDFLVPRFVIGAIALVVLVIFGEIINRVGRYIKTRNQRSNEYPPKPDFDSPWR